MAGEINYKQKYQELKAKYMNAVDVAFRLGFEEGSKQSQMDQANQQMQEQAAAEQAGGQPGEPGAENNNGAPGTPDQGAAPDKSGAPSVQPSPAEAAPGAPTAGGAPMKESEHPEGSELDRHISELEAMIKKSEEPNDDLQKSLDMIKSIRENMIFREEMKKSSEAIPAIAKALHKPQFKFGVQAAHNLSSTAKSSVSMHHKIVNSIMEKWEKEESKAHKDILSALNVEGVTKD
jgi:hypothetical protein